MMTAAVLLTFAATAQIFRKKRDADEKREEILKMRSETSLGCKRAV